MTVRYVSTEGELIEDVDSYLLSQKGGDSRKRRLAFKKVYAQFSCKGQLPEDAPVFADICYRMRLSFGIYAPVSVLMWMRVKNEVARLARGRRTVI